MGGFSKPRTAATQSLSSVLLIRLLLFPSTDGHGPFLSPPSKIPPSSLSSVNFPVHLSLLLLPPLRPLVVYLPSSPLAPVVTRRPPVRLTGGRCHATPGCLLITPTLDGLPPQPVRLVLLGLGVGGGRRRRPPPDDLGSSKCFTVPVFDALDSPRCSFACLCLPPPLSAFTRTTALVPLPSLQTEEYFRGRPACPHPASPPVPYFLTAS